jgi:lysophospholipase L1-like esterase
MLCLSARSSLVTRLLGSVLVLMGVLLFTGSASANTLTQNTSWTIDRPNTTTKYRVVAYGDSIYAGYYGNLSRAVRRAAPMVQGEYLSNAWGTDIEVIRRAKSGAKANDIYNNKIVAEKSYMQSTNTRVVSFEMCGNDFLQARDNFVGQTGTCSYASFDNALSTCSSYQQLAMQFINANASANVKKKQIMNLYYPGYAADNGLSSCTDPATGQKVNKQDAMFPRFARSNWRACNFAAQYGFDCVDAFAAYMGADYDSNGDGQVDSEALKWKAGESENDYVTRITVTLRSTIKDANTHFVSSATSYDYIQSDNVHPTYYGSATIYLGNIGGSGTGTGAPELTGFPNAQYNKSGHERAGWEHALLNPAAP